MIERIALKAQSAGQTHGAIVRAALVAYLGEKTSEANVQEGK
jgi:hypothetical protein